MKGCPVCLRPHLEGEKRREKYLWRLLVVGVALASLGIGLILATGLAHYQFEAYKEQMIGIRNQAVNQGIKAEMKKAKR